MAQDIPTTKELADRNLAGLEGALSQTSPLNDKAFLRVLAVIEAFVGTSLHKFGIERTKQNLALTATGEDLDRIGSEVGVIRKLPEATVLTADLAALDGTIIPVTAGFTGSNGLRYYVDATVEAAGGVATLSLTAETAGSIGNLPNDAELNIVSPVAGAENVAVVTGTANTGADTELDSAYRLRVLFAQRAITGGGNATDYKIWAEAVAGVARALPYAGKPYGDPATSYPGDRTVYIESTTEIDGIPTQGLLDEVRAALNIDPDTGKVRPALGITDSTLYVEPITRTAIGVQVLNLVTPNGQEATVKAQIENVLTLYFATLAPFVTGVDLISERNDLVTVVTIAAALQSTLAAAGSTITGVTFSVAAFNRTSYQLNPGELAKRGVVSYATA